MKPLTKKLTAIIASLSAVALPLLANPKLASAEETFFNETQRQEETLPESPKVEIGFSTEFLQKYICRGVKFGDESLQSLLTITHPELGFTAGTFLNYDFGSNQINEIDPFLDYTLPITEDVLLSLGYTYFHMTYDENTQEIYAGLTFPTVFLSPSMKVVYDFDQGKGQYFQFSAGKEFNIGPVPIVLGGSFGIKNNLYGESGPSDLTGDIGFPFQFGRITVIPTLYGVKDLDGTDSGIFPGISFNASF